MQPRFRLPISILLIVIFLTYSFDIQAQRNPSNKGTEDRIQKRLPNKTENPRPRGDETIQRERIKQTEIPKVKNPPPVSINDEKEKTIKYHPRPPKCYVPPVYVTPQRPSPGIEKFTKPNYKVNGIQKYKDGEYEVAYNYLCIAIEEDSNDYELYYYRGLTELKIHLYEEAELDFDKYLEFFFYEPDGYFQRGLAKFYLNEKIKAKEDFEIAADMDHKMAISILKRFY